MDERMKESQDVPNEATNKHKAEGEQWSSDDETVERRDHQTQGIDSTTGDEGGGATNRPLGEETGE